MSWYKRRSMDSEWYPPCWLQQLTIHSTEARSKRLVKEEKEEELVNTSSSTYYQTSPKGGTLDSSDYRSPR